MNSPRLSRRALLPAALLAPASCRRSTPKAAKDAPNILFIIADDQSWPHAGIYGSRAVRTPAFDRIAREGVLFTHSFTACPSCTPSRSAVLTGRNIWQVGEAGVLYGTIAQNETLFPHILEDAGYHCGFTGKGWGPGDWNSAGLRRHPIGREYNQHLLSPAPPPGIDTRDAAANFDAFLKDRPRGAPFFFWFGSTEPHRVYDTGRGLQTGGRLDAVSVPPFYPDTPEVRSDLLDYCAEVDWYDTQLARVLAVLERTGELDRTLIIGTSDNGMPFPRAKVNLYDAGTRMPLAMRWGARLAREQLIDDLVSHVDLGPTMLDAAGLVPPESMEGRSLLRSSSPAAPPREFVFTALERHTMCRPDGATYPMRAIRGRRYQYIRNFAPDRWPTGGEFLSSNRTTHGDVDGAPIKDFLLANAARYPREYELCFGRRPAEEFYDVFADPGQIRNLAADPAAQAELQRHRNRLNEYLKKTRDPRIEGRDPWQSYAYRQTTGFGASFNKTLPEAERRKAAGLGSHKPE